MLALQQNPPSQAPFPTAPQFAVQAPMVQVGVPLLQARQAAPMLPQAEFEVPATHTLLWQQPPLQLLWFMSPQMASHTFVVLLHAVPMGQSAATAHPHLPATHWWPAAALVQLR